MKWITLILWSVRAFMATVRVEQMVCGGARSRRGGLNRFLPFLADSYLVGVN